MKSNIRAYQRRDEVGQVAGSISFCKAYYYPYVSECQFPFHLQVFVGPLQSANILERERYEEFLRIVFPIQKRLYDRHVNLLEQLLDIQRAQNPVITELIRTSGLDRFDWKTAYEDEYANHIGDALNWLTEQTALNSNFELFLNVRFAIFRISQSSNLCFAEGRIFSP